MQNPIIFACFQPILTFFPPDLLMKYRIFISTVDISANLKNIDIDIDIDKEIFENIDIDIDIDKEVLENIDIDIDIDKEILENIDINKISNRLEFGISNSPTWWSNFELIQVEPHTIGQIWNQCKWHYI